MNTTSRFRRAGIVLIWALLLCCSHVAGAAEQPATRPNIILCMGDDHGWEEAGYNGHSILKTPVLDEMAATGLRLDRFYSAHPSCSPTRGSIITGRHPNRYGTFAPGWSLRPGEISIARLLADAGYACGHFGKWHLGPVKAGSPTNPGEFGFHQWVSHDNFFETDPVFSRNGGEPEKFTGEGSEIVARETMRFIDESVAAGRPFFTVVWFGSPHEPYIGLEEDLALYEDLPASLPDKQVTVTGLDTGRPAKRPYGKVLQERFAEITAMDRAIGQLRTHLEKTGQRQNTLLWYCGDNGIPAHALLKTPFRGAKGDVYEGGVRVPGLIEWPAVITSPRASAVNAVTSDMLPTVCDIAGVPLPDRPLDGVSLKPLMDGNMTERPGPVCLWNYDTGRETSMGLKPVFTKEQQQGTTPLVKQLGGQYTRSFRNLHHPEITDGDYSGERAIIGNRYKLVVRGKEGDTQQKQLFDLREDPGEQHDLAAARPETVRRLEQELRDWQQSVLHSLTGADYPQR